MSQVRWHYMHRGGLLDSLLTFFIMPRGRFAPV
jgi:hypothetical protein